MKILAWINLNIRVFQSLLVHVQCTFTGNSPNIRLTWMNVFERAMGVFSCIIGLGISSSYWMGCNNYRLAINCLSSGRIGPCSLEGSCSSFLCFWSELRKNGILCQVMVLMAIRSAFPFSLIERAEVFFLHDNECLSLLSHWRSQQRKEAVSNFICYQLLTDGTTSFQEEGPESQS